MAGASMEAYFLADFSVIHDSGESASKLAGFESAQAMIVDDLRHENADRAVCLRPRVTGC
jgi:hypothetical protein